MSAKTPFTCPKCGYQDAEFHHVCPECGRPFLRDYIDTQMHSRDPDLTGICTSEFWIRVFLALVLVGIGLDVLYLFRVI